MATPTATATATTAANSDSKPPSAYSPDTSEVKQVFGRFDANGDGKISSEELEGVMRALGSGSSPEEISRMMEEIDSDKDGFICLEEFTSFYGGRTADAAAAKEIREAFEVYDQDHDGFISAPELHQILTRLGERFTLQDCEVMINSVDTDQDRRVSFDEFKTMMTRNKKAEA